MDLNDIRHEGSQFQFVLCYNRNEALNLESCQPLITHDLLVSPSFTSETSDLPSPAAAWQCRRSGISEADAVSALLGGDGLIVVPCNVVFLGRLADGVATDNQHTGG